MTAKAALAQHRAQKTCQDRSYKHRMANILARKLSTSDQSVKGDRFGMAGPTKPYVHDIVLLCVTPTVTRMVPHTDTRQTIRVFVVNSSFTDMMYILFLKSLYPTVSCVLCRRGVLF